MTSVVFTLDLYDTYESPLEINLEEFTDYVNSHELSFTDELHKRIWNHMVYTGDMGKERDYLPMVFGLYLDVEGLPSYVDISLAVENDDGGWHALVAELSLIASYGEENDWDNKFQDNLLGFLAHVQDGGWYMVDFTPSGIKDVMSSFYGMADSLVEVVDYLVEYCHLEPCPAWVVHDEEKSAKNAMDGGHFKAVPIGWRYAVWY